MPGVESERSIPTCVGQPPEKTHRAATVRVYPHVCGAAGCPQAGVLPVTGLSPRVWGSPIELVYKQGRYGSIPTCVGQPCLAAILFSHWQVYPHVCGAAVCRLNQLVSAQGLSPRVWGSRLLLLLRLKR